MKRRIISLAVIVLIIISMCTFADAAGTFAASKKSNVYHRSNCGHVRNINSGNLRWFSTINQAEAAGYRACQRCRPDLEGYEYIPGPNQGGNSGSSGSSGSSGHSSSQEPGSSNSLASSKETSNSDPLAWIVLGGIGLWVIIWLFKNRQKQKVNSTNAIPSSTPPAMKERTIAGPELKSELKSSVIKKATYNSKGLCIEFTNGSTYIYYSAPQWVYDGLIRAKSPGSYFHQNIKDTYPYEIYRK